MPNEVQTSASRKGPGQGQSEAQLVLHRGVLAGREGTGCPLPIKERRGVGWQSALIPSTDPAPAPMSLCARSPLRADPGSGAASGTAWDQAAEQGGTESLRPQ